MACTDIDGDGIKDIVTGKCFYAHNGRDPGAEQPAGASSDWPSPTAPKSATLNSAALSSVEASSAGMSVVKNLGMKNTRSRASLVLEE
jgi:hypothetical protein